MKILAVDTSTNSCSVAIVDKESLLAEVTLVSRQTHSKHLMKMINTVTDLSDLSISEMDGFAVTSGPGSFTGLRIGISSIKGLAAASDKPVVGVSSLDAIAMQFSCSPHLICPFLDARGGEVYFSRYRFEDSVLKKEIEEQVLLPEDAVCDIDESCIFVGDGASIYKNVILDRIGELAFFAPPCQDTIRASTVAHLSMNRFKGNDTDDISAFAPHYIRKSYAELKAEPDSH